MRSQQPHRGEVDRAAFEHLEDHGEAASRSRHLDAVVGLGLGKGQDLPAIGEERPVSGAQVHVARAELGEVGDELGQGATLARGEILHARDELAVFEATKVGEQVLPHTVFLSRVRFRAGPKPLGRYRPPRWRSCPRVSAGTFPR